MQGELAIKDVELVAANREAEKLLKEISESTAVAEKEKHKVALIVEEVSKTAKVGCCPQCWCARASIVLQQAAKQLSCMQLHDGSWSSSARHAKSACRFLLVS